MARAADLALVKGMEDTKRTLRRWNERPLPVLGRWIAGSAAIAALLLLAVYVVAKRTTIDPTGRFAFPGLTAPADLGAVGHVVIRNSLVLALHGFACVAGFIAGSSLPGQADDHKGVIRWLHVKAGPAAIVFVTAATLFSLLTQATVLGDTLAQLSAQGGMSPGLFLVGILPHAIPELVALFLPLAAWMIASRNDDWHELLAATFVTVLLAAPVAVMAAFIEVYVSPHVILALRG